MNSKKFLQVQRSLTAVGDDLDILNYIANDIIFDGFFRHLMTYPAICGNKDILSSYAEKIIIENPFTIPKNVTDYYVNKQMLLDITKERFKKAGWYVAIHSIDMLRKDEGSVFYIQFSLSYQIIQPTLLDKFLNIFKR